MKKKKQDVTASRPVHDDTHVAKKVYHHLLLFFKRKEKMSKEIKTKKRILMPFIRDTFLARLTKGARFTKDDEYPIIEEWMVAKVPPKNIIQYDKRNTLKDADKKNYTLAFYCDDKYLNGIISNIDKLLDEFSKYESIIGMDASPYDNMPLRVQQSQIYLNISSTYYAGRKGISLYPNVRLGDCRTLSSLQAYPKGTLISVGTNGFLKNFENRNLFANQLNTICDVLNPTGIIVYGPAPDDVFSYPKSLGIKIFQYDSYIQMRWRKFNERK